MQIKFNLPTDFGNSVAERQKAPSRHDYIMDDFFTTIRVNREISASLRNIEDERMRDTFAKEDDNRLPKVGDVFILPEKPHFIFFRLSNGKKANALYLEEKNTGRVVRLFVSQLYASVGNFASMIKKDPSYDERFIGKTLTIDNEFYEELVQYDEYGYPRAIRNHRVLEINIKDQTPNDRGGNWDWFPLLFQRE